MVGVLLKIVGVIVLIGGVLGLFIGGFTILYGELRQADADDEVLLSNARDARSGQAMTEAGIAIVGGSFLVSGLGLSLLVAGIAMGGRERDPRAPQPVATPTPPRL